jgi:hypothetical protein
VRGRWYSDPVHYPLVSREHCCPWSSNKE